MASIQIIESLKKIYENLLQNTNDDFCRDRENKIDPSKYGPIVLVWERWVGKTYLLLQKLKKQKKKSFYFAADNPLVQWISLFDLVSKLYFDYGIRYLVIDEINKWEDWMEI